jgi:hypothetical protein
MTRVVLLLALVACSKKEAEQAPPADDRVPPLPAAELERGKDACTAYVDKICACTAPDAKRLCDLAKALPDALQVGLEVSMSPDSDRQAVLHANDSMRKTIKECIEQAAKLPSLGC